MEKALHDGIIELVNHAKLNEKIFVFGYEVYTPEEAEDAMLTHAEEEIENRELTVDEYLDECRECMADMEEEKA